MTTLGIIGAIAVGIVSFIAGWLAATEKTRLEVYKRHLDTYQHINKLASDLFNLSVRHTTDAEQYFNPMVEARIKLSEFFTSHAIFIAKDVGTLIIQLVKADKEPDIENMRVTMNTLIQTIKKHRHPLLNKNIDTHF